MSNSPFDDIPVQLDRSEGSKSRRVSRYMLEWVAAWRERRTAKLGARRALALYIHVHAERPDLAGESLYEAFLCRRNALEPSAARRILLRAESSFANWPQERDLIFRDIVQYLVISEYLDAYPKRVSTATNMIGIIASVIPQQL